MESDPVSGTFADPGLFGNQHFKEDHGFRFPPANSSFVVVVFGPPGSGKGTQSALISQRLQLPHISTGDMLRDRILQGDSLGRQIAERIDHGRFVPDSWIDQILDERLVYPDCRIGCVLDGYPRTSAQAERFYGSGLYASRTLFVIRLKAEAGKLAERFSGRRQCDRCGALFHLEFQPSLAGDFCDRTDCNGRLAPRADDREEFLQRRLEDYAGLTRPVLELLFPHARLVVDVDAADGTPDEIHERIWAGLNRECDANSE